MKKTEKTNEQLLKEIDQLKSKVAALMNSEFTYQKTEKALDKSKEQYYDVIMNLIEGFYSVTLDGKLLDFNTEFIKIFGLNTNKDYTGIQLPNFWQNLDERKNYIDELMKTGFIKNYIIHAKKSDGEKIVIQINSRLIKDDKGKPSRIEGTFLDISERYQAEEALQKSNSLLSAIIESPDNIIMFALDTNYNYLSFNKAHAKEMKFIYDADIENGKHIFSYIPNKEDNIKAEINYKRVLKGERFTEIQEYGEADSRFWYELIFNPIIDTSDQITGFTVFVSNITERKQAEETQRQYEHIVSSSTDMLAFLDNKYTYLAANAAYMDAFDLTSEQLIGETVADVFGEEFFKTIIKPQADRCLSGEEVNYQDWFDFPSIGRRYMDITYYPYYDEGNKIMGFVVNGRNITERKKSEEQIKRFSRIFEDSLNEIFLFDEATLKFIQVNNAAQNNLGYSMAELQKMTPLDIKPEFTAELFTKLVAPLNKGKKKKIFFETVHQRKDKSLYDVEVHLQLLHFENEDIFAAIIMDITERKKAEGELRTLSLMVEQSTEGMALADLNGTLLFSNMAWCKMHGYENPKDYLGESLSIFHNKEQLKNDVMLFNEKVKKHGKYSGEVSHITKEGKIFPTFMTSTLLKDLQGNPFAIAGIANDITDRKQAENILSLQKQKLADILEGTNAGIWDWNIPSGKCVFNDRWAEIMGYTLEELKPIDINTWINHVHPDDLPNANLQLEKLFKKESNYYDVEFRQPHKDGKWVWVNARGKVIEWAEDGKPLQMSGTHLDITERKLAEEELAKHHEQLEELVKERTRELEEKNKKLDDAMKVFVGREMTIKKLQDRIKALGRE